MARNDLTNAEKMAHTYNAFFNEYHSNSPAMYDLVRRRYAGVMSKHMPGDRTARLLDIGCGTGFFLNFALRSGFTNVCGIDLSPGQVEAARKACPGAQVQQAEALEYLGSRKEQFDFISMNHMLEHVPKSDVPELLAAVRDALTPGGRLAITVPNGEHLLAPRTRYRDFTHEISYTVPSLIQLLGNAGFDKPSFFDDNPRIRLLAYVRIFLERWLHRGLYRLCGLPAPKVTTPGLVTVADKPTDSVGK